MSLHCDVSERLASVAAAPMKVVGLIALGAFALGMASYMTAGLIPLIQSAFSVPLAVAAQLVTAFTLAYGLGSPMLVAALPAHGQRTALLVTLAIFVAANAASALATSLPELMLARAVAGVGAGVYLALGIGAAATVVPPTQRGKAIAVIMGGMASGTVLGVPLGVLLAERLGWQAAFWLVALLGGLACLGLAWRLPALPRAAALPLVRKLALLADRQVLGILAVSLLAAIASLGLYTYLAALLAPAEGDAPRALAVYLWVWGLGGILGSFLVGPLADRVRAPQLTLGIMVLLAASLLALPMAVRWDPWLAMAPIAVWGAVGWALQVPQNNLLIQRRARQGDGNVAVALNESALYLGSALGAAGGGVMLALHWPAWSLAVGAAMVAALGALLQAACLRGAR